MGAYESSYAVTKKETIKGIKPSNAEWLFRHAESVDMPISQVQRCWRRFLAMGCDKSGNLTQKSSIWKVDDIFVQQILRKFPWSTNRSLLTFQAYLKLCKWFSIIDEITRLKVLFYIINEGEPLNLDLLQRFFHHIYSDKSKEELQEILTKFLSEVDYKEQGFIDEEEFVGFAKKLPYTEIAPILTFQIIPSNVYMDV